MANDELIRTLEARARTLRRAALPLMREMGMGWLGGCFSEADVVTALLFHRMRHDPSRPGWPERDRLVISKGHSCEIVYAAVAEAGYIPREELATYSHTASRLQTHLNIRTPGVDYSGGSLGLGLSFAVGTATGAYIRPTEANLSAPQRRRPAAYRVYCVLGDGESNEGQVWEAAAGAAHHRLDNLTVILDQNGYQSTGPTAKKLDMSPFADKFRSFGWAVREIDGNDMRAVVEGLDWAVTVSGRPQALIARTVKGKGLSAHEQTNCHFVKMTDELLRACQEALRD